VESPTDSRAIILGIWTGIAIAIVRSALALIHNLAKLPPQLREWENQVVCHRCSHRFPLIHRRPSQEEADDQKQ
jgi:hypothetical protein